MIRDALARVPGPAVIALFTYLLLAAGLGGHLPFVQWSMFRFYLPKGATVTPLFLADGQRASEMDYTDYIGLSPEVVDLEHSGYECGVEHKLQELHDWLKGNQGPAEAEPGPVQIQVGLTILSLTEDGQVVTETRIDATGSARKVNP
jgi:hypothetical protein